MSVPNKSSLSINYAKVAGHGAYGKVYELMDNVHVTKHFDNDATIEYIFPMDFLLEMGVNGILKKELQIIKNIDVYKQYDKLHVYTVMDKYQMDLGKLLRGTDPMDLDDIKYIIKMLIYTLAKAQESFIIHRDIKPQNILINLCEVSKHVKDIILTDWGLSKCCYSDESRKKITTVQTLWYRAPEQLLIYEMNNNTIDMWSVGIIALELITHTFGYLRASYENAQILNIAKKFGLSGNEKMDEIFENYIDFNTDIDASTLVDFDKIKKTYGVDDEFMNIIKKMLVVDPLKRITPIDALNDVFFEGTHLISEIEQDLTKRIDNMPILCVDTDIIKCHCPEYIGIRPLLCKIFYKCAMVHNFTLYEYSRMIKLCDYYICKKRNYYDLDIFAVVVSCALLVNMTFVSKDVTVNMYSKFLNTIINTLDSYQHEPPIGVQLFHLHKFKMRICLLKQTQSRDINFVLQTYNDILYIIHYNIWFKTFVLFEKNVINTKLNNLVFDDTYLTYLKVIECFEMNNFRDIEIYQTIKNPEVASELQTLIASLT
jgi:hypothetical protein